MPRTMASPSTSLVRALAACLLPLAAACSNVRVQADSTARTDLAAFGTYAYMDGSAESEQLEERIEAALDVELAEIGLTRVPRDDARLLVAYDTFVEVETRYLDPFERAFYNHERYEVGTLLLEMIAAEDDRVVWSGTAESQLRVVARGSGLDSVRYEPTDEQPDWKVQEKVERLLARFPRP